MTQAQNTNELLKSKEELPKDAFVVQEEEDAPAPPLKPHIDVTDAFTLISRMFVTLIIGGISVAYVFQRNIMAVVFFSTMALLVQIAAIRLIQKMRKENAEYIAQEAAKQAEAPQEKQAANAR